MGFLLILVTVIYSSDLPAQAEKNQAAQFSELLNVLVNQHDSVAVQTETLSATRARRFHDKLIHLPTISAEASAANYHSESQATQEGLISPFSANRTADVTAKLNLYRFGADEAIRSLAAAEERTQELVVADTRLNAEKDILAALIHYIVALREQHVVETDAQLREESLRLARASYSRGLYPQQEVDKLALDLASTETTVRDAQVRLLEAEQALRALRGANQRMADIPKEWPWKEALLRFSVQKIDPATAKKRPDVLAAQSRVEAAGFRKDQHFGPMLPRFDASARYGMNHAPNTLGPSTYPQWTITLGASMPLFDRLSNYGEYKASIHEQNSAEIRLAEQQRQAESDIAAATGALELGLKIAKTRDENLAVAQRLYQEAVKGFQTGLVRANDIAIDAQRLFSAEQKAIEGWSQVHMAFGRYCHAQGHEIIHCGLGER